MTAPPVLRPTTPLLAIAWGRRIPKLATYGVPVASALPADISVVRSKGFVTVLAVGGTPEVHLPMRHPVVSFSAWAAPAEEGSTKIPKGRAGQIAEWIWEATTAKFIDGEQMQQLRLSMPLPGYAQANLRTVTALSEPVEVTGDPGNFARFDLDIEFTWTGV